MSPSPPLELSTLRADRRVAVAEVLELTGQMLEAARVRDWDRLVALEAERRPLISKLFEPDPEPEERAVLAAAVRQVQEQDQETMRRGGEGLVQLQGEMRTVGSGRKAVKAYGG